MSALADKIPELRQLAYSMYQDEGNEMRANLEMLMALEQGDYAKYTDLLGQWNTDRNFDYGVHRDQISDNRYNNEWNYQVGRDDIADKRYEDETAWERSQYTSEKEYNQALAKAQTLAAAGDFSRVQGPGLYGCGDQEPQDCIRQGTARLCEQNAERKQLFLQRRQQGRNRQQGRLRRDV